MSAFSVDYLVTGGGGFIGSNLVRSILRQGSSVRVFDNFSTGRKDNLKGLEGPLEILEGDLRNVEDVQKAVEGVRYVLHLGALGSVGRSVEDPLTTHQVNETGTLNLLIAARDAGVERFVLSSSSSVYGNTPTLPKVETMTPNPLSPYALSKLSGEHHCRIFHSLYGFKTYVLRYFNVFGPRQDPGSQYAAVIPLFVDAIQKGEKPVLNGDGEQTRDFTYVGDIVRANLACCKADESAAGDVYNVAWGNRTSVKELALEIATALGKETDFTYGPARAGDVQDSQADSAKAREKLGWEPQVTFEEGLKRTADWFTSGTDDDSF